MLSAVILDMSVDATLTLPWVRGPRDVMPISKVKENHLLGHGEEWNSVQHRADLCVLEAGNLAVKRDKSKRFSLSSSFHTRTILIWLCHGTPCFRSGDTV